MEEVVLSDVNEESFRYWRTRDPVTLEVMKRLSELREELETGALEFLLVPESADLTLSNASRIKGNIEAIDELLSITFEGVKEEKDD